MTSNNHGNCYFCQTNDNLRYYVYHSHGYGNSHHLKQKGRWNYFNNNGIRLNTKETLKLSINYRENSIKFYKTDINNNNRKLNIKHYNITDMNIINLNQWQVAVSLLGDGSIVKYKKFTIFSDMFDCAARLNLQLSHKSIDICFNSIQQLIKRINSNNNNNNNIGNMRKISNNLKDIHMNTIKLEEKLNHLNSAIKTSQSAIEAKFTIDPKMYQKWTMDQVFI